MAWTAIAIKKVLRFKSLVYNTCTKAMCAGLGVILGGYVCVYNMMLKGNLKTWSSF